MLLSYLHPSLGTKAVGSGYCASSPSVLDAPSKSVYLFHISLLLFFISPLIIPSNFPFNLPFNLPFYQLSPFKLPFCPFLQFNRLFCPPSHFDRLSSPSARALLCVHLAFGVLGTRATHAIILVANFLCSAISTAATSFGLANHVRSSIPNVL